MNDNENVNFMRETFGAETKLMGGLNWEKNLLEFFARSRCFFVLSRTLSVLQVKSVNIEDFQRIFFPFALSSI